MSYMHCFKCGNEDVPDPSISEDLIYGVNCPRCNEKLDSRLTTEEWLVELCDRIQNLEEMIK